MPSSERSKTAGTGRALFDGYTPLEATWDEFFAGSTRDSIRPAARPVSDHLNALTRSDFRRLKRLADDTFLRSGITFTLYDKHGSTERIFPFDLIPRVIDGGEWAQVEQGIVQRILALNCFLADVYGEQRILDEKTSCPDSRWSRARRSTSPKMMRHPARPRRRVRAHRRRGPDPRCDDGALHGARGQRARHHPVSPTCSRTARR